VGTGELTQSSGKRGRKKERSLRGEKKRERKPNSQENFPQKKRRACGPVRSAREPTFSLSFRNQIPFLSEIFSEISELEFFLDLKYFQSCFFS